MTNPNCAPAGTWLQPPESHASPGIWQGRFGFAFYQLARLGLGVFHAVRSLSLMAPSVANPYLEGGGLTGYSRSHILSQIRGDAAKKLVAPWTAIRAPSDKNQAPEEAMNCLKKAGLTFPLLARPDASEGPQGVALLRDESDLARYARAFPKGERFIIQQATKPACFARIYYERRPDDDDGRIVSMAFYYYPLVIGDGVKTVQELVIDHPSWGSEAALYLGQCAEDWNLVVPNGMQYRLTPVGKSLRYMAAQDARDHITPQLRLFWDDIFRSIPEFYAGSIVVGAQTLEGLETGKDITVVGVEGPSGLYPHLNDAHVPLRDALSDLNEAVRTMFDIGVINKKRGHKPDSPLYVFSLWLRQMALRPRYPSA